MAAVPGHVTFARGPGRRGAVSQSKRTFYYVLRGGTYVKAMLEVVSQLSALSSVQCPSYPFLQSRILWDMTYPLPLPGKLLLAALETLAVGMA